MNIFEQLDELERIEKERIKNIKYFTDDGVEIVITHVENTEVITRTVTWDEYLRNPF